MYQNVLKIFATTGLAASLAACGGDSTEQTNQASAAIVAEAPTTSESAPEPTRIIPALSEWAQKEGASIEKIEDGDKTFYRISVADGHGLTGFNNQAPVTAGDTINANFMLWSDVPGTEARIRIARFCGAGENEQTVITRSTIDTPRLVALSHTFENDQGCARLQFDSRQDNATFFVSDLTVTKD